MSNPLSWKDKFLAFLATAVLLTTVAKANPADFLHSYARNSHISGIYPLYSMVKDTGWLIPVEDRISSKYVRRERNSNLAIVVPNSRGKYRIRFFDEQDQDVDELDVNFLNAVGIAEVGHTQFYIHKGA